MRNCQDTFETCKQSFISVFSICMTVPSRTTGISNWVGGCLLQVSSVLHIYFSGIFSKEILNKYLVICSKKQRVIKKALSKSFSWGIM